MENKINNLLKQNQSIYNSLVAKNIPDIGTLVELTDEMTLEQKYDFLVNDNVSLKKLVPKPVSVPKVVEPKIVIPIVKPDDDDEDYKEPVIKYDTITNMEDMKRAFFSEDYELFENLVREHNFRLYNGNYKFSGDKDGCAEYNAKNLIRGFVRNFEDYGKYFMICFRCFLNVVNDKNTFLYTSLWIVNTNDDISKITGTLSDDFELKEVLDKDTFYKEMRKLDPDTENLVGEGYVH